MYSYTFTLFVLAFQIHFDEGYFTEIPEKSNTVGHKHVCEDIKSENKYSHTIEQCSSSTSDDNLYNNLNNRIMNIKKHCGELCETDLTISKHHITKGQYYDHLEVEVNCNGLWNTSIFDESSNFQHAPQKLPSYIKKDFRTNIMYLFIRIISTIESKKNEIRIMQTGVRDKINHKVYLL